MSKKHYIYEGSVYQLMRKGFNIIRNGNNHIAIRGGMYEIHAQCIAILDSQFRDMHNNVSSEIYFNGNTTASIKPYIKDLISAGLVKAVKYL